MESRLGRKVCVVDSRWVSRGYSCSSQEKVKPKDEKPCVHVRASFLRVGRADVERMTMVAAATRNEPGKKDENEQLQNIIEAFGVVAPAHEAEVAAKAKAKSDEQRAMPMPVSSVVARPDAHSGSSESSSSDSDDACEPRPAKHTRKDATQAGEELRATADPDTKASEIDAEEVDQAETKDTDAVALVEGEGNKHEDTKLSNAIIEVPNDINATERGRQTETPEPGLAVVVESVGSVDCVSHVIDAGNS